MMRLRAIAIVAVALAACGVRTDPRPPEDTMAQQPAGFLVTIEKGEVRLVWERPTESEDGHTLDDLVGFRIERAVDGAPFEQLSEIPVGDRERVRTQRRFKWRDLTPVAGHASYRVRAYAADGQAGTPSTVQSLDVDAAVVEHAVAARAAADAVRPQAEPGASDTKLERNADGSMPEAPATQPE